MEMNRYFTYRSKHDRVHFQIQQKSAWVISGLMLLTLVAGVVGIGLGDTMIHPLDVLRTILGSGSGEYDFIVHVLRLPRAMVALLVGAALASQAPSCKASFGIRSLLRILSALPEAHLLLPLPLSLISAGK